MLNMSGFEQFVCLCLQTYETHLVCVAFIFFSNPFKGKTRKTIPKGLG